MVIEMDLKKDEKYLLLEAINHSISYRLKNRTRMSEIKTLKELKKKVEKE